ncbi:MAG: DNA polymerase III subunit beta [Clostridia bacterium]|nr:DNA polymerase III subunit beta [Clostridia bacterium]MBQ7224700.1 DNA polymerase III subunit beta [Clostridia bacterium]
MKLICNGNDLSDAVGKVYKAVSTRTTNPILEGIKLKAENGTLRLTATDLELAIEKIIVADVKIDGETVVPGRFFAEFVKKLTQEQIELSLSDSNRLKIKYTDSEGELQCLNPDDYPQIKELADAQKFVMAKNQFKDLINKVAFSVATDDARPMLKGVQLEIDEMTVTGVALDGYRLAKCVKTIEKTTAMMRALVPARCLVEIARLIDDSDESVEVCIQKNYLAVDLEHTRVTTRLMDVDFINYKQIIPAYFETIVTLPREQFEAGLERAILLSRSDKSNLVRFDIKENVMQLSSNSDIGNITEKILIKLDGKDLSISFNARYFTEILRYIDSDSILIKFTDAVSPCIIVPTGALEDFMYLILPVRMQR